MGRVSVARDLGGVLLSVGGHGPPLQLMDFLSYITVHPDPFLWKWGVFHGSEWGIRYYSLAYLVGFCALFVALRWQGQRG